MVILYTIIIVSIIRKKNFAMFFVEFLFSREFRWTINEISISFNILNMKRIFFLANKAWNFEKFTKFRYLYKKKTYLNDRGVYVSGAAQRSRYVLRGQGHKRSLNHTFISFISRLNLRILFTYFADFLMKYNCWM